MVDSAEQRRLDVLRSYEIVDVPVEDEYANVVALAASILGMPDAYITLLEEDRQWIKAATNKDYVGNGPLELSFCRHMIATHEPMIVEDTTVSDIFKEYANVTGFPYIRFYAGVPLEAPEGEVLGALCVSDSKPRQVTAEQLSALKILAKQVQNQMELRRASMRLGKALAEAEEARKARDLFFASVSHDIRTPAAAIVGASKILKDEELSGTAHKLVEGIESNGKVLTLLLNNLLDLAKMDSGKFELVESVFDLEVLLREVAEGQAPVARAKGIELVCEYDPVLGKSFYGDPLRIRQILGNLVSNSVKFTHEGTVLLSAKKSGDGVVFRVKDTGIGIADNRIASILNEFEQADSTTHGKYGGTGLGLSIVSKLTGLMKGQLNISSMLGMGSEFLVQLPLSPAKQTLSDRKFNRILVVDDNPINRMVVEATVSRCGTTVDQAASCSEARAMLANGSYDLVLLDEHLQDGRGTDLAREIRSGGRNASATLLGISASIEEQDVRSGQAAGLDGQLPKPFSWEQLLAVTGSAYAASRT